MTSKLVGQARNAVAAAAVAIAALAGGTAQAQVRTGPPQVEIVPVSVPFHYLYVTESVLQPQSYVVYETHYDDFGRPFSVPKTITRFVTVTRTKRIKVYDN